MKLSNLKSLLVLLTVVFAASLPAQNNVVTYQGRVQSGGTNFTGAGQIKFALVTPNTTLARQATATATVANGFVIGYVITDGGGRDTRPRQPSPSLLPPGRALPQARIGNSPWLHRLRFVQGTNRDLKAGE